MRIHFWSPNLLDGKGGIQVFSQFLLQAIRALPFPKQVSCFALHDTSRSPREEDCEYFATGRWPRRLRAPIFGMKAVTRGAFEKPDLIITTHLHLATLAHFLKLRFGIPYWTIVHGIEAWDLPEGRRKQALLGSDRILCVSEFTRQRLYGARTTRQQDNETAGENSRERKAEDAGQKSAPRSVVRGPLSVVPGSHCTLLPNTFDPARFKIGPKSRELLQRYGLCADDKIIFTLARLAKDEQYKGYDKIIEVLPRIREAIPNVKYLLAGKGGDRGRVEAMITRLHLGGCVRLAGYVADDELNDHYNLCDVFAMPSKGEGFGIVFLEAMGCGKPVLAGNQDGSVDALNGGELGALVNTDDRDDIAGALIKMLNGMFPLPLMYQPEQLRRRAVELFGFEIFQNRVSVFFDEFLSKRASERVVRSPKSVVRSP